MRLKSKSCYKSPNDKCWSDLDACNESCCIEDMKLENSNFYDFSRKYGNLRANIKPKTQNHVNEQPPTSGTDVMTSQENLTPNLESFRIGRNRVFALAGEKPCFSNKMDNMSVFGDTALILSTKFGLMDEVWDLPCTNTSLVDDNLRDFSKHALWTAVLKPIPLGNNSVPVLNVSLQQPNPCQATIGNCGTLSMLNSASDLRTSAAMLFSPALCEPDQVSIDEA